MDQAKEEDSSSSSDFSELEQEIELNTKFANINKSWRVKYYQLKPSGNWNDVATGQLSLYYFQQDLYIKLEDESNKNEVILNLDLRERNFQFQNESIITMTDDPKNGELFDIALSFQMSIGLTEMCSILVSFYGPNKITKNETPSDVFPEVEIDNLPIIARLIRSDQPVETLTKIIEKLSTCPEFYDKLNDILFEEEKRIFNPEVTSDPEVKNKESTVCTNEGTTTTTTVAESIDKEAVLPNQIHNNEHQIASSLHHVDPTIEDVIVAKEEAAIYAVDSDSCISNNHIDKKYHCEPKIVINDQEYNNLKLIHVIYKSIFSISNQNIIELLLSEKYYLGTFAALECKSYYNKF